MCAINGFNFKDENLIRKMNQITSYRGPDGTGIFLSDGVSLGHNRLSIIDLSDNAAQPMKNAGGNLTIIFNGEIYNYRELKKELGNYPYRSESDTEIILAAYEKWGSGCVEKFNGIFAFAIWADKEKELFLARDHTGVKPLYYFWNPSTSSGQAKFIFSSEIKAILAHNVPREMDLGAFNHFLRVSYVPHPLTIFKNIKKLENGHWLKFQNGNLEIKKYWGVADWKNFDSKEEGREKIKEILEDSVSHQIISDRPVGIFLSGGLDSSVVLGLARKFSSNITKTYTTGFKTASPEDEKKFNVDFELARQTARHYGTDHHELMIGAKDISENLEKVFWHLDEPNGNTTAPTMFLLSEMAKKDVTVVLSGDGGDELFGGYPRYFFSRWISKYQKYPFLIRKAAELALAYSSKKEDIPKLATRGAERISAFLFPKDESLSRICNPGVFKPEITENYFADLLKKYPKELLDGDFERIFMDVDRSTWISDECLMRTDRMLMANALEGRVPILDYRLIEVSQKIPTLWKIKNRTGKLIFRDAFSDYLLPHFANKPKWGWFTPMAKWLREEPLKTIAWDYLNSLPEEFFNKKEISKMFDEHLSKESYNLTILWALISFSGWYNSFVGR